MYLEKQLKELKLGASSGGKQGRYDPVMSAMAMPLSDEDIADLAAYYASMPISGNTTPEDVVAQGKVLYTAGDASRGLTACIACHGRAVMVQSYQAFQKFQASMLTTSKRS